MPQFTNPDELAAILAPFVNARFNRQRDERGYVLDRTTFVDILAASHMVDADIRGVTADGVERFFDSGCELIRWDEIRGITIRNEVTCRVAAEIRRAA